MVRLLNDIPTGKGTPGHIAALEELGAVTRDMSLCGLGKTSPNPVLSTLRYFRDEYEAHIHEKRCPAGVCKELIEFTIDPALCNGCTLCARQCPQKCIAGDKKQPHVIDQQACIKCGVCFDNCNFGAVKKA